MKYRFHVLFTVVLVLGFGLFGRSKLSTYTNITANPDFVDEFCVAELSSSFAIKELQEMKDALSEAPIILKVTPVQPIECFFRGWQQKVRIEKVFSGVGLEVDSEIDITSKKWDVYVEERCIDVGFVNFMEEGTDYLVFLSTSIGYDKDGTEVFQLQVDQFIAPVFSYETHDNVIYPVSGESTYVPYQEVSANDFFSLDEEGLEKFIEVKEYLLQNYQ